MPDLVISEIARKVLKSPHISDAVRFSWHSGEPMVLDTNYYRNAIKIIKSIREMIGAKSVSIDFDIQTNATLITQDWCDFISEMNGDLLIGVSCDGPAELHNNYRKNWSGRDSHTNTERGMLLLAKNGIKFDVTAVVSPETLNSPEMFLEYFAKFRTHIREFHFNLHDEFYIEDPDSPIIDKYAKRYERFLKRILALLNDDVDNRFVPISNFSSFYNRIFGSSSNAPDYSARAMSRPLKTLSIESNGDVTTFYAGLTKDECSDLKDIYGDGKGFVIGNIIEDDFEDMVKSQKLSIIARDFEKSHRMCEAECEYEALCSGGYNLIKYRRFNSFEATETPECRVHVKTFARTLLDDINLAAVKNEK